MPIVQVDLRCFGSAQLLQGKSGQMVQSAVLFHDAPIGLVVGGPASASMVLLAWSNHCSAFIKTFIASYEREDRETVFAPAGLRR